MTHTSKPVNKAKDTPKLRFAGFSGAWEEKKLGEIFPEIKSGKDKPESVGGGYFVYGSTGVIGSTYHFSYNGEYILVARVGVNAGKLNRVSGKFGVTDNTLVLEKMENANTNFFYNLLNSKNLNRLVFGSGQPLVTSGQLKKLKVIIPKEEEQKKIADFLGVADAWIENLRAQKENFESYKKGIMQKIFSQQIRFKDEKGKDFSAWEEKKLGELTRIYDGTHQTPDYVKEGVPFYSVEHITANDFSDTKFISKDIFEKEKVKLEKNDILMTKIGDIGTARLIDWDAKASFYVSLALIKQSKRVSSSFLAQYINALDFQRELWKRTIHVAFPKKINLGEIGECNVILPSLPEQQKIADFLTSVDKVIESKQHQITQAEIWKKGLMQGLFV